MTAGVLAYFCLTFFSLTLIQAGRALFLALVCELALRSADLIV